jgi:hypothetical protein
MGKGRTNPLKPVKPESNDCIVPPALPKGDLHKLMFRHSEEEARDIRDYVEWQARGEEKVLHAEKVAHERIMGRDHDVWDVHTDKERWWVITAPTNLYSQTLMPSLDYTLSFHVGLMARVASKRALDGSDAQQELVLAASRKLVQAGEALDAADEAEEFQAVGMRCRECLIALTRELGSSLGIVGDPTPKGGDFPAWNELIGNAVASGSSEEYVRGYLKISAERAWRLASWLTHAANATRADAELSWDATAHVVANYTRAALRLKSEAPERCGRCQSYRIAVDWRPEIGDGGVYVARCEACGAEKQSV